MTAGTAVIMWLGELITDRGVGNGMSILIFTSIVSRLPRRAVRIKHRRPTALVAFAVVMLVGVVMVAAGGLRRAGPAPHPGAVRQAHGRPPDVRRHLDLHPAEGQPGRRDPGHLRLVAAVPPGAGGSQFADADNANAAEWTGSDTYLTEGDHPIYMATYFLLIVFFAFFYVAITFNPD